jgi:hypothetical protein
MVRIDGYLEGISLDVSGLMIKAMANGMGSIVV